MNEAAQRALAALAKSSGLKKLEAELKEAQSALTNVAGEINDRFREKDEFVDNHKKRKRKEAQDSAEAAEDGEDVDVDANIEELRRKVDGMTNRMDEKMQKLIDARHEVEDIQTSLAATAEDAQRFASTQISTQNVRSQRRTRRAIGSGEEDEEEEYEEFDPTAPTSGSQAVKSMKEVFNTKHDEAKTRYQSHSRAARYASDNDYILFRNMVHEARYPEGEVQLPHASEWFPEGGVPAPGITARPAKNTEEDDDDDIAIAREQISTKCPLTLQEFVDPVSSKKCNHSYERGGMLEFIRSARGNARCPVTGCSQMLTKSDLHVDAVIVRKIKRIQRAREIAEQDAEDEDAASGANRQGTAALVDDDDEDGVDVDAVAEQQTRTQARSRGSEATPASAAPDNTQQTEQSEEGAEEDKGLDD